MEGNYKEFDMNGNYQKKIWRELQKKDDIEGNYKKDDMKGITKKMI